MKNAKEEFDKLVETIKKGQEVTFGQLEKLFAEAFLHKFIKKISSEKQEKRSNEFFRENILDEDYRYDEEGEPVNLSNEQLTHYRLELARILSGTLGVRPSVIDLSDYIKTAVSTRDWKMLDKVLSLTEEGKIEGVIEKIALEDLVNKREESLEQLEKQFPNLNFTPEIVRPAHEKLFDYWDEKTIETTKKVIEYTRVPIPEDLIQKAYEDFVSNERFLLIGELYEITKVKPTLTKKLRDDLEIIIHRGFGKQEFGKLLQLLKDPLDIYSNKKYSKTLQKKALSARELDFFEVLYENSEAKLSENTIRKEYAEMIKLDDKKHFINYDDIITVFNITKVVPKQDVLRKLYTHLLGKKELSELLDFYQKSGAKPEFEKEKIQEILDKKAFIYNDMRSMDGISVAVQEIQNLIKIFDLAEEELKPEYLQQLGTELIEKSIQRHAWKDMAAFLQNCSKLEEILKEKNINLPPEVTALKITAHIGSLSEKIDDVEREYTKDDGHSKCSPLQPVKGYNIILYHGFRTNVRKELRKATLQISKLKNSGTEIQDSELIQTVYQKLLELALVEAERDEEKFADIGSFIEEIDVKPNIDMIYSALKAHLERNHNNYESAENLIEKIAVRTGISLSEVTNKIAEESLNEINPDKHIARCRKELEKICYLAAIGTKFRDDLMENISTKAAEMLKDKISHASFDYLAKRLNLSFSEKSLEKAKNIAFMHLMLGEIDAYEDIKNRIPIQIDSIDIRNASSHLLAEGKVIKYDVLLEKFKFDTNFTEEQKERIRKGIIEKANRDLSGEYIISSKLLHLAEINKRAGFTITATPEELHKIIDSYKGVNPQEIAQLLNQELDKQQIEERIINSMAKECDFNYSEVNIVKELIKNTGITPSKQAMDSEIEKCYVPRKKIKRVYDFNKVLQYKPDQEIISSLVEFCLNNDLTRDMHYLIEINSDVTEETARKIITASFDLRDNREFGDEWYLHQTASKLMQNQGYSLQDEQKQQLIEEAIREQSIEWVMCALSNIVAYNACDYISREDQHKVFDRLYNYVAHSAPTSLKKELRRLSIKHASKVITDQEVRQEAGIKTAELLASDNVYKGYMLYKIVRAEPVFTPEQYEIFQTKLKKYERRFNIGDYREIVGKTEWRPA